LTSTGRVLELTLPKAKPGDQVTASPEALARETARASVKHNASHKRGLACSTCGISLYETCGWCGQTHCWLHAPADHPGQTSPRRTSDLDNLVPTDYRLFYLAWLFVFLFLMFIEIVIHN